MAQSDLCDGTAIDVDAFPLFSDLKLGPEALRAVSNEEDAIDELSRITASSHSHIKRFSETEKDNFAQSAVSLSDIDWRSVHCPRLVKPHRVQQVDCCILGDHLSVESIGNTSKSIPRDRTVDTVKSTIADAAKDAVIEAEHPVRTRNPRYHDLKKRIRIFIDQGASKRSDRVRSKARYQNDSFLKQMSQKVAASDAASEKYVGTVGNRKQGQIVKDASSH